LQLRLWYNYNKR